MTTAAKKPRRRPYPGGQRSQGLRARVNPSQAGRPILARPAAQSSADSKAVPA
jgi:hypothetical protein